MTRGLIGRRQSNAAVPNVLFLCTGNSARSIIAEVILNELGGDEFRAHSAGSHPTGVVNPAAIVKLNECGHDTSNLRSKSWDEFKHPRTPACDYVITVCDDATSETCPVWSGSPKCIHWGIQDPAAVSGSDDQIRRAFDDAYVQLKIRISELFGLPE